MRALMLLILVERMRSRLMSLLRSSPELSLNERCFKEQVCGRSPHPDANRSSIVRVIAGAARQLEPIDLQLPGSREMSNSCVECRVGTRTNRPRVSNGATRKEAP